MSMWVRMILRGSMMSMDEFDWIETNYTNFTRLFGKTYHLKLWTLLS